MALPLPCEQTDTCKDIPFPQLRLRTVKIRTQSEDAAPEFVFDLCVIYSYRFRDYDKKSKAICADHPYSKRKAKDESGEKSDQDNDSSADEAPVAKKVKVDARMVTNQRTGVPVTGSSASDDSCQSQPAKTPPHSAGSQLPSTPTPTPVPSVASTTLTKPEKSSTPFSMDNILRDVINKDLLDEGADGKGAKDAGMPTKGGILSKLDELDSKDESKEKGTEETAEEESASEDKAWDISVEIIDFIISDALKICEVKKRKISMQIVDSIIDDAMDQSEERRKKEDAEKTGDDVDKDISIIEISDSDVGELNKNAQKQRDAPFEDVAGAETTETHDEPLEKNEGSEDLAEAEALLRELKELSGETGTSYHEEKPVIIQDAEEAEDAKIPEEGKETPGGDVRKTDTEETKSEDLSLVSVKTKEGDQIKQKKVIDDVISIDDDDDDEIEIEAQTDTTKHGDADNRETEKDDVLNCEKDEAVEDREAEREKDEIMKDDEDDTSQDSTAEALERLKSELNFLNESLFESASESVPDSSNVEMEWEDAEEKPDTVKKQEIDKEMADETETKGISNDDMDKPDEPHLTPKVELNLKKELVKDGSEMSGNKRQTEGIPDAMLKQEVQEQPGKMSESPSTTSAIVKQQSQALSVIGMEYASSVTSESDAEERISSGWIKKSPLAKILESSKEGEGIDRDIRSSTRELRDVAKCEKEIQAKQAEDGKENVADEQKIGEERPTTCLNDNNKKEKDPVVDTKSGEAVKSDGKEMNETGETAMETTGRTGEAMDTEAKEKTEETKAKAVEEDKGKDISKEKGEDKDTGKENEGESNNATHVEEKELLDLCLKGLSLCLKRFPQHFKSLYRLAYVYYHSKDHRVSQKENYKN